MSEAATEVSPHKAAYAGKCPNCGQGVLYQGILKLSDTCANCSYDIASLDQGDGPAAFAIFFVGTIVMVLAVWLALAVAPPLWVHMILWVPLTFGLTIASLRFLKSWLLAEQFKHKAREGELDI